MKSDCNKTILLVEDSDDDVFAMKRALRLSKASNPLQVVTDGQQALDYLSGTGIFSDRERYPLPFIIFLDLKLPYLSGFEVLTWIRRQTSLASVAVVILTGSAEDRDKVQAFELGAQSYLVKPPTAQILNDIFESFANYRVPIGEVGDKEKVALT